MLIPGRQEFITLLSTHGYSWPPDKKAIGAIITALSAEVPSRDIRVTAVTGWRGKFFVLPGESYGPRGPDKAKLQMAPNPGVRLGGFRRFGTLDEWQKRVAAKCAYSSRATLAVAANFAAPNLRIMGLSSFGFNFSGPTSGGKTLLLRVAASTAGLNEGGNPSTWDGTPAGLEQRIQGHRDCIVPLDEIGALEGDPRAMVKLITFRLAGNRGKERAAQYVMTHNLTEADCHAVALSTSEDPLWDYLNTAGRRRIRGEEVRMINVRACISDMKDVFDGPFASNVVGETVDERRRFVERLERCARKYQGEAFRAYLTKRAADHGAKASLQAYMDEFVEAAPLPDEQRWLGRIRKCFAVVYAGAAQAIDYGVLPWSKKSTLRAIKACMNDAMLDLIASCAAASAPAHRSDEWLLVEFKRLVNQAEFVRLPEGGRKNSLLAARLNKAEGMIRSTKRDKVQCLLFGKTLDAWFPEVTMRRRLTGLLRSLTIFHKGRRPDTTTRQVHVSALGKKVPCYAMSRKRLRTWTSA
jgi:hypothetical protein